MNRQIKFRAWHMPFGSKGPMQQMLHRRASSILSFAEMNSDAYIVEQFTGLKDATGDDIYENDLVLLDPDDPPYQVIFDEGKFEIVGGGIICDLGEEHMGCIIIGNVHTSPELLEADK